MKRLLAAFLALAILAAPAFAAYERIKTTRPTFDLTLKADDFVVLDVCTPPFLKAYYSKNGMAYMTITWTGQDVPVLWIWGPEGSGEIQGVVIREGDEYFKISLQTLYEAFEDPCSLPK